MAERFTEILMEHFLEPRNRGVLQKPDGTGVAGVPGQGPLFVIQLLCSDGVITQSRFNSHNCGVTIATGSVLTEMILIMRLEDAVLVSACDIEDSLGGVPIDKRHVPKTAIAVLHQAIEEATQ